MRTWRGSRLTERHHLLDCARARASVASTERAQTIAPTSSSDGSRTSTRGEVAEDSRRAPPPRAARSRAAAGRRPRRRAARRPSCVDGSVERRSVEDGERAALRVVGERGAKRGRAGLAVHLERRSCAARSGTRRRRPSTAARGSSGARAAGALLAPRLRAAAGDEPAALRARACPARAAAASARTASWTRCGLTSAAKTRLGERDVLGLLARRVEHGCLRRGHQRLSSRTTT